MPINRPFFDALNVVLGMAIAAFLFCVGHTIAGDSLEIQLARLKEWQTLATGFIAVIVGGMTVRAIMAQIHLAKNQEEERTSRKLYAAKTALPAALSSLLNYSEKCVNILHTYRGHLGDEIDGVLRDWEPEKFPNPSDSALLAVQLCVEFETDATLRDALAWPLQRVQILSSRLSTIHESIAADGDLHVGRGTLTDRLVDQLEFQVRLNQCFDYAPSYPRYSFD